MATALAAQLARIRAKSSNSLDLKAQRKAHSKSLLFDPRHAASQDFDTIYQLCYEGFVELCRLDPRFAAFAKSLFSEQSKDEDRTLMTQSQNEQLNVLLEDFMCLVCARLLLNPALQAVEWLVRRFRVHEYNSVHLVMTFLPYHTHTMFPTVLAILPSDLPATLKFLHPYIQTLTSPSRHTVVYTATQNPAFLAAFNAYILRTEELGFHCSVLQSYWASIVAEATAAMLDAARSGRLEAQMQKEEDVFVRLAPVVNSALSMNHISDLRVGCYMIITILASKSALSEEALTAFMDAVTNKWSGVTHAGLIALAVLAQRRHEARLPRRTLKALILIDHIEEDLNLIKINYSVNRLALGLILGLISRFRRAPDVALASRLRTAIEADLLDEASIKTVIATLIDVHEELLAEPHASFDIAGTISDTLSHVLQSDAIGRHVREAVLQSHKASLNLQQKMQSIDSVGMTNDSINDYNMLDVVREPTSESVDEVIGRLPTNQIHEPSFLSSSDSHLFASLAHAFILASKSSTDLSRFSNLPILRRQQAMTEPLFISFHIRVWCGPTPAKARSDALEVVSDLISHNEPVSDVQVILPYVLYALADPSSQVRLSAAKLVRVLKAAYKKIIESNMSHPKRPILGDGQIYGEENGVSTRSWMSLGEASTFLERFLVPNVEESLLDSHHVGRSLAHMFGAIGSSSVKSLDLKNSLRHSIFMFLCDHVTRTPLKRVKLRLLEVLNLVQKVGSTTRTKALFPLISNYTREKESRFVEDCKQEGVDPAKLSKELLGILSSTDRDGIHMLGALIAPGQRSKSPLLNSAVFKRITDIWPSITHDLQSPLAESLLELAVSSAESGPEKDQANDAAELLRQVKLSSVILSEYLDNLPSLAENQKHTEPAWKRRKTNHGRQMAPKGSDGLRDVIGRYNFVLELTSMNDPAKHPQLLKGLFDVLAELRKFKSVSESEVSYLEVLTLDSAHEIIKANKNVLMSHANGSSVRPEVLIDCMSNTGNTQVHQAALMLVASIASTSPELILHSVMPIFTSMGGGIMRNDDEYSAHVISKTMESIIPQLVQALRGRKVNPVISLSELFLSFVAAYKDIPIERRHHLFCSLVDKTGPDDFLFALLVLLVDKYPGRPKVLDFAAGLVVQRKVTTQLVTAEKYLGIILDILDPKPSLSIHLLSKEPERSKEDKVATMLPLLTRIFKQDHLKTTIAKVFSRAEEYQSTIRLLYGKILEHIFVLQESIAQNAHLAELCRNTLESALELLPLERFIETIPVFFDNINEMVRCDSLWMSSIADTAQLRVHVMQSLKKQLQNTSMDHNAACVACLAFLSHITAIIHSTADFSLKRAAVVCADQIIEKFGKKDVTAVATAVSAIAGSDCLAVGDEDVRIAALLCLTTAIEALGEALLPTIPQIFPLAMDYLIASLDEDAGGGRLHNACVALTTALLLYIPWIMKGAWLDRFLKASHESANAEMGEQCDTVRIECLRLFAKSVEPSECISALDRTWMSAMVEGPIAAREHLEVLRLCIERQPKTAIAKHSDVLADLFLKVFDLRRVQFSPKTDESYDDEQVEDVETAANDTLIAMIYKVNDAIFRPIFSRLIEWSTSPASNKGKSSVHRKIAVWRFLHHFISTLKSIVTNYAGHLIEEAVEILNKTVLDDSNSRLLWQRVLSTLQAAFEHDQDDFFQSPSHFQPLCTALLAQLPQTATSPHSSSLLPQLISTITFLATTTDAQAQHKSLCSPLLQHLRDDRAAIRFAAVKTQLSLTEKLGEEWLGQLPEMLPFIAEGMEDDDEGVEMQVRKWVTKIEGILGESIAPMLQ
ncbi:MAG: hypothetical protein Q9191_006066 [Dirinaria sp. TL-2023a]